MTEQTISREELKEIAVSDLLDISLDSVEDALGFLTPPKGFYRLALTTCGLEEVNDKEVIKVGITIQETIELVNPTDTPAPEGGTFDQTYFPGFGVQQFKTEFKEVAEAQGFTTFGELIGGLEGLEVTAHIGHRKDKNDKEKVYPTISKISLV